jgi:transcriptional regulator NrdR family protein
MNRFLIIISFLSFAFVCHAQVKKSECSGFQDSVLHKSVYRVVDQQPEPIGGIEKLLMEISKRLKYTGESDFGSRVIVAFVVEPDGKIDGERVIRGPSAKGETLTGQIFKIIKTFKWKPGKCFGKAVPVLYTLPIIVDLSE